MLPHSAPEEVNLFATPYTGKIVKVQLALNFADRINGGLLEISFSEYGSLCYL